jgi:glucose-6-phosphate dehydrogenase assembly protein OpcA
MHTLEHVPVASIESELSALWDTQLDPKKVKACLFSLVIYTKNLRRIPFFEGIIHSFIEKYPCRILFIQGNDQDKNAPINIKISNVIVSEGDTVIGCDQIVLETGTDHLHRIPFIILPHIVPDLPLYFLWGENPATETRILPYLQEYGQKLIFDSEWTEDLQSFSKKVLTQIDRLKIEVVDFNWAILSGWRKVMAQTFDSPEKIQLLNQGATIYISYNNKKTDLILHTEINALYLQAWLAAQLGWNVETPECQISNPNIHYSYKKQQIEVKLVPEEHQASAPGDILSIEIYTKEGCSIEIARKREDPSQVYVHIASPEKCELPFTLTLPNLQREFNFINEVFYHSPTQHYHNMLTMLSQTRWNICSGEKK